jgi:predicted GNAT family acetyltransferase
MTSILRDDGPVQEAASRIVTVADGHVEAARAFLLAHVDTSLFLLSNLRAFGPRAADSPYSGEFRALVEGEGVRAVWCTTRSGNLVLQTGGAASLAPAIAEDAASADVPVSSVLGDWPAAPAVWQHVRARRRLVPTQESREVLYRLHLPSGAGTPDPGWHIVSLTTDDFTSWDPLAREFLREQRLPVGTPDARWAGFARASKNGHWWGAWEDGRLVSIASFNAFYAPVAQIGGVYTVPERRRAGLSRAVMQALIRDAAAVHHVDRLILFTGENARPARALYESLGFEAIGSYGLFFGEPMDGQGAGRG